MKTESYTIAAGAGFGPATVHQSLEYPTVAHRRRAIRRAYRSGRWLITCGTVCDDRPATVADLEKLIEEYGTIAAARRESLAGGSSGYIPCAFSHAYYQS